MTEDTRRWLEADAAHCWHPFTDQDAWTGPDGGRLVITGGEGAWLTDSEGQRYLDGNSSIWTNIPSATRMIGSAIAISINVIPARPFCAWGRHRRGWCDGGDIILV